MQRTEKKPVVDCKNEQKHKHSRFCSVRYSIINSLVSCLCIFLSFSLPIATESLRQHRASVYPTRTQAYCTCTHFLILSQRTYSIGGKLLREILNVLLFVVLVFPFPCPFITLSLNSSLLGSPYIPTGFKPGSQTLTWLCSVAYSIWEPQITQWFSDFP